MSNLQQTTGQHEGRLKYARQMRACVKLIDKIIEDDYGYYSAHNEKWGKVRMGFEPTYSEDSGKLDDTRFRATFYRPKAQLPAEREQENAEFFIACRKEEEKGKEKEKLGSKTDKIV